MRKESGAPRRRSGLEGRRAGLESAALSAGERSGAGGIVNIARPGMRRLCEAASPASFAFLRRTARRGSHQVERCPGPASGIRRLGGVSRPGRVGLHAAADPKEKAEPKRGARIEGAAAAAARLSKVCAFVMTSLLRRGAESGRPLG